MKIIQIYGNGKLGFKRVGLLQWALSKLFPYKQMSKLGLMLASQKMIVRRPRTGFTD